MQISNPDLAKRIIEISFKKKLSHLGSCLSAMGIIDHIYSIKKPDEKFVLSSGHAGLALYCVIEKYGGRNAEEIFDHHGVHPDRCKECGLEVSTGSLGHGLGIALGLALADRSKNVYCLVSDGECSEGSIHEALRVKDELQVDNLIVWINKNKWAAYKEVKSLYLAPDGLEKIHVARGTMGNLAPYPFIKDQDAHYKVLNWQEYQAAMKALDDQSTS